MEDLMKNWMVVTMLLVAAAVCISAVAISVKVAKVHYFDKGAKEVMSHIDAQTHRVLCVEEDGSAQEYHIFIPDIIKGKPALDAYAKGFCESIRLTDESEQIIVR